MKLLISLLFLCISTIAFSQEITCYHGDMATNREKNILPYDLVLDLHLKEKEGKVEGKANYKFSYLRKEVDTFFFDAIQFDVSKITINNEDVKYRTDSAGITVYLPQNRPDENTLTIDYSCFPNKGMYFLNWNNPNPKSRKQIWTQGQGIDNRHWIPGFDASENLLRMTTRIRFNDKYPVVSNGDLISTVQNDDKTKTWTYKMSHPHTMYLAMVAAGDYAYKNQKSKGGIIIEQYYYPDHPEYFEPTYQHSEVMMDWFEKEIKVPYAWGKVYRNVPTQDFLYGAMENTTATIFADYMHGDSRHQLERAYLGVNAHELAHQWFGDLITERSAPHHWLHESFATHYSKKFMQFLMGDQEFDMIRKRELDASFNAGRSNSLPIAHSASGSARHYPKGSFVLDMLRNEIGDENYRNSIAYYLKKHYHKNVETSDLVAAIYEKTGRNVKWFFDQWIHRGGEPVISFKYKLDKNGLTTYTEQIQRRDATIANFRMPMTVSIYYKNGAIQYARTELKNEKDTFHIALEQNAAVTMVLLDENMDFLRKISYDDNTEFNLNIAKNSTKALARLEAIERLKDIKWKDKSKAYLDIYHAETFPRVKSDILDQINIKKPEDNAIDILVHGLKDEDVYVRRSAINAIEFKDERLKLLLIERLNDSSYFNIEAACKKLIKLYPTEKTDWLGMIKGIEGIKNNLSVYYHSEVLKDDALKDEHSNSLKAIKYLASENGEYRSRVPAINFLFEENIVDLDIAKSMIQGALYFHRGIQGSSVKFLKKIKKDHSDIYNKAIESYPFHGPNQNLDKLNARLK